MSALTKTLIASMAALLISQIILLHVAQAHQQVTIDCGAACAVRCQRSSRPNLCKRTCGTCCARCNCVPPGTSGHFDVCPCYANQTTRGGRLKCP